MNPRETAKWICEEHAKVQDLAFELRQFLNVPPVGARAAWLPEVRERFARLCTHLRKHMRLEEADGYMKDVVARRPTLTRQVEILHHEHGELERLMSQIDAALAELAPADSLLIRHAVARIGIFLSYVEHHKEQEEHLVMYTFTEDLGVGD